MTTQVDPRWPAEPSASATKLSLNDRGVLDTNQTLWCRLLCEIKVSNEDRETQSQKEAK